MTDRRVRILTDAQLAQCRWEYENTSCSQRYLATKFGVHRGAIEYWITAGSWAKYVPPERAETLTKKQAEAFERQVKAAAANAHDAVLAEGLAQSIEQHKPAKGKRGATSRATPGAPADRPAEPPPDPPAAPAPTIAQAAPPNQPAKDKRPGASVIPFPGARPPPPKPDGMLFPTRSKIEEAELRVQLSTLRGMMSIRQIHQLERHKQIIAELSHLFGVYLAPHDYVAIDDLAEADAQAKLLTVQRAALSLLLPTEGDTLAGALKALTSSLATTINLERTVSGHTKGASRFGPDDDRVDASPSDLIAKLGTDKLREWKAWTQLLSGEQARQSEPPQPPPPDSLEDLRSQPLNDPDGTG